MYECTYVFIDVCMYAYMYVCIYANMYVCMYVYLCMYHGAMGRRIDPSWWTHWAISRSSQCPTTGVTKTVVCVILSV